MHTLVAPQTVPSNFHTSANAVPYSVSLHSNHRDAKEAGSLEML